MNRGLPRVILVAVLLTVLVGAVGYWTLAQKQGTSLASITLCSSMDISSPPEYCFDEEYRNSSHQFLCRVRPYTESGCALFVSDISGKSLTDIGVYIDYGLFERKILPSPNGKYLLLVQEHSAILLDTSSLAQKVIFQAPSGRALGTYDAFPAFIPYVKWVDNNRIQISIFNQDTQESYDNKPPATPLEVKMIQV